MAEAKKKRRAPRKKTTTGKGVRKVTTGIPGLDEALDGGLPAGRVTLIAGPSGAGKTVFLNEFVYRGIVEQKEPAVFVTFEESPDDISANVTGFGRDYDAFRADGLLTFVDLSLGERQDQELGDDYDLGPIVLRVKRAVEATGARRVVIDSIANLFSRFSNEKAIRAVLHELCRELRKLGATILITAEQAGPSQPTRYGVEEYVADTVLEVWMEMGEQQVTRRIGVRKMRGASYHSGAIHFSVGPEGLRVYPKIRLDRSLAKIDLRRRRRFGIDGFDELFGGGLPRGHITLISGNTGTGKSTFCMHFARDGVKEGEPCVYVALEEPSTQLRRAASAHNWGMEQAEKQGLLRYVDVPLIDVNPDKLLYDIVDAVRETGAKRLVIDSVSSLESATLDAEQVRQFLIQLADFAKSQGLSVLLTYLVAGAFGAGQGQLLGQMQTTDMRLSSIVDSILLLRYVERGQKVKRLLNVLKLRGSRHDNALYLYTIGDEGIRLGEQYEA